MIGLGLSAVQLAQLNTLLTSNHQIAITAHVLDLNHNRLSDVSPQFVEGQVTYDWTRDITRSLNLTFFDPRRTMGLDASSPAVGALYVDRMLATYYHVMTSDLQTVFTIPVFTGPITKIDRDSSLVQVECQGKEILSQGQTWNPKTYKKGMLKVSLIRDVLATLTGETKFSLPSGTTARIGSNLALSTESKPWDVAKWIAKSMGYQLFYDGRGTVVMNRWTATPRWNFGDEGVGASVLSKPAVGYDLANLINAVQVKGVITKGTKKLPLVVRRYAAKTHPLSPWSIGRGGVPRFLFETIDDDTINSQAEAIAVADTRLAKGLIEVVTASFDTLPIPHLELQDTYRLQTSEFNTTSSIFQMTLPLNVGPNATMGYLKYVKPDTASIRRNRR